MKWANLWRCTRIHEVNIRRWNLRLACCNESKVKRGQRVLCNDALTVWMSRTSGHIRGRRVCRAPAECEIADQIRLIFTARSNQWCTTNRKRTKLIVPLKNYWQSIMFDALMSWAGQMFKTSALMEGVDVRAQSKRDCSRRTSDLLSQWRNAWRLPTQI